MPFLLIFAWPVYKRERFWIIIRVYSPQYPGPSMLYHTGSPPLCYAWGPFHLPGSHQTPSNWDITERIVQHTVFYSHRGQRLHNVPSMRILDNYNNIFKASDLWHFFEVWWITDLKMYIPACLRHEKTVISIPYHQNEQETLAIIIIYWVNG